MADGLEKRMYTTEDYEAGNVIDEFETYEDALKAVVKYEADDRKDGSYEDGFYAIHMPDDECIRIYDAALTLKMLKQARHEDAVGRGKVKTERKAAAARENGKKGGRPRKK